MVDNKPFLIRLVGIIELIKSIYGMLGIFAGLIGLFVLSLSTRMGVGSQIFLSILSLVSGLVSIVGLIAAIAVIRYKPLGRKLLIFVGSISILLTLMSITYTIFTSGINGWFSFFSIIYYGAVIGYFMTSEAKNAFEPPVSGNKKV